MRIAVTSILLALILCSSAMFVSASERILSEAEQYAEVRKKYSSKENRELNNILVDFEQTVDPKYYAGAYYDNTVLQLRELYIFVTDMSVVPDIDNDRLHFILVKYSIEELDGFRAIIEDEYVYKGLHSLGTDIKNNKLEITFFTWTDLSNLDGLIPEDSYEYELSDETSIDL